MGTLKTKLDLTGHIYGRLTVISEVEPYISPKGERKSKWLCQCKCGNTKEIVGAILKRGESRSCGCHTKQDRRESWITHRDTGSKEYIAWAKMIQRCLNPNDTSYPNYGGRGITICPEWINSYEQFLADVGRAPSPEYSIDRIDNNGNYEPNNVRWSSKSVQQINRRTYKNNSSGHKGIYWHKKNNNWTVGIRVNNKQKHLGCFSSKEEAIAARKLAEEIHHQPLLDKLS